MLRDLSLLVADDDPSALAIVGAMLAKLNVKRVVTAASGSEALDSLRTRGGAPFDCLIADVRMPCGTGLQLLHAVRTTTVSRGFRSDMCVILMSATVSPGLAQLARQLDVNGLIAKPFSLAALQDTIAAARRRVFPLNQHKYASVDMAALAVPEAA
jgi:CheY-like chemotaxis protein